MVPPLFSGQIETRPPNGLAPKDVVEERTPMRRYLSLFAAFSLVLIVGLPGRAQDSPSLGDLARQAQKDKEKDKASKPAAKVFTNDDMPSSAGIAGAAFGGGMGQAGAGGANLTPAQQLAQLDAVVNKVESLDKATLVRNVLKDKSDVNFPGRATWEQRLMAAKAVYVEQSRALLQKARQIVASADNLKNAQDPNDPRVKEIAAKLQDLSRDAVQTNAGLQAVIIEGQDLASQASAH